MHPTQQFTRVELLSNQHISHGPIHIIRVDKGKLGYAMDTSTGQPMLLIAGTHYIRKAEFKWGRFLDLTERVNNIGALKMIRVDRGQVAYFYRSGELQILQPGLHVIAPPDRFGGFVSTQLQLLDLPKTIHESGDYVRLEIDADVLYAIVDPALALIRVQDLEKLIRKTAISTLAGIIRSSNLSEVAGSRRATFSENLEVKTGRKESRDADSKQGAIGGMGKKAGLSAGQMNQSQTEPPAPSAPSFQQKVHDEFLKELHDYARKELGVEISNIRINDLRIASDALANNIAKEAIKIAEQEAEYRMLQKEADIRTVRANNIALETKIKAQAQADEKMILIQADNDATIAKARATAEAVEISAKADKHAKILAHEAAATGILTRAKAEKDARVMHGEADEKYAKMVSATTLGSRLAELSVQKETLKGLGKVAYVPGLPNLLKNSEFIVTPKDL
mmetsp:Transcript_41095/g.68669  ORF Transcript_41095/g.68669 Transcript_41095/m.68669 type:complete len:451 (+) Transcript_41095:115-1467(+)